jgi:4-carboxymuconolactone decarboxylase
MRHGQDAARGESESYRRGMERRDQVMGPSGGRRRQMMRALHPDLEQHLIGHAWGEVNARPGLDVRTRELITVGILLATGRDREATGHMQGALNVGVTRDELVELLLHCSVYAGFPAMVTGAYLLADILEERGELSLDDDE